MADKLGALIDRLEKVTTRLESAASGRKAADVANGQYNFCDEVVSMHVI